MALITSITNTTPAATAEAARAERASQIEDALASVRMEGLEPSAAVLENYQRYVDGELNSEELDHAMEEFFSTKYGPVRIPGN